MCEEWKKSWGAIYNQGRKEGRKEGEDNSGVEGKQAWESGGGECRGNPGDMFGDICWSLSKIRRTTRRDPIIHLPMYVSTRAVKEVTEKKEPKRNEHMAAERS